MAQLFEIHPDNPQRRLIQQAVAIIDRGGLVIYPTDSSYALGCYIGDKNAMERIQRIRRTDSKHHFTLVYSDLSEIGTYAKMDNSELSFDEIADTGSVHLTSAGNFAGSTTTNEPETQNHWRQGARQQYSARPVIGAGSADHEQHLDSAGGERGTG